MLCEDKNFPKNKISNILSGTNKENINSKIKMYELLRQDEAFPQEEIPNILVSVGKDNVLLGQMLCEDKNFPKNEISNILFGTNKENINSKIKMYELLRQDEAFPQDRIGVILKSVNEKNLSLAQMLCADEAFPKDKIGKVLDEANEENLSLAQMLCADEAFPKDEIGEVLNGTYKTNVDSKIELYNLLKQDETFPMDKMHVALNEERAMFAIITSDNKTLYERAKIMLAQGFECHEIMEVAENELYYKRTMELLAKPNMDKDKWEIIHFAKTSDSREYANILELSDYFSGTLILEYEIRGQLGEICTNQNYIKNKELILKVSSDKKLKFEAQSLLTDRILGIYDNDYSKLTLREKMQQINILKEAQSCDIFTAEERNFLNIDNEIIELQEAIKKVINTTAVSKEATHQMMSGFFANNNPQLDNLLSTTDFSQFGKSGLPLEYSRQTFVSDLSETLKDLPETEQADILNKLGITLTNVDDVIGYDGIIDLSKLSSEGVEGDVLSLATKFIKENSISTGDSELDEALNSLIQGMPEFINIIGKQQHQTQDFSLDIHVLTVLKEAMSNPNYQNLSNQDKFCLKFATILHDIAKLEGVVDDGHAELCALYARDILNKDTISLPVEMKDRIYELIKNHHWLADYNTGKIKADNVAVLYRRAGDLEIAQIMAEADLKGVKADGSFYDAYGKALDDNMQMPVQSTLSEINSQGQMFLTNKIIDPRKIPRVLHNGTEYQVINFADLSKDFDLQQYGFEPGTTVDNLRLMIHTVHIKQLNTLENVYALSDPSYQGYLCVSYVSANNHATYCNNKFGVSLETEQVNIANAAKSNQGSGCGKDFSRFSKTITGKDETSQHRSLIPSLIKQTLGLSNDEYSELFAQVQKYKYTSQLDNIPAIKIGDKTFTGTEIKEAILKADDLMITSKSTHNEANLYSPKVNAVIAKVDSLDKVPQELLDFAQAHNLPIYLLGE